MHPERQKGITQRIQFDMIMVVSWKQRRYILRLYDIRQSPRFGGNTKLGASYFYKKTMLKLQRDRFVENRRYNLSATLEELWLL